MPHFSLRRVALVLGTLAVALPGFSFASPGDKPNADRTTIDGIAYGGQSRYTMCGALHSVEYGGLSANVALEREDGLRVDVSAGAGALHDTKIDHVDGESAAVEALHDETSGHSDADEFVDAGLTIMLGADWRDFGFALGPALLGRFRGDELLGELVLPAMMFRGGDRGGWHARLTMFDQAPLSREVFRIEGVYSHRREFELGAGIRGVARFEASAPAWFVRFGTEREGFRVAGLLSGASMVGEWTWQGELSLGVVL